MLEEFTKLLGPLPFFQILLGLLVFGAGVWAIVRGITGKDDKDEQRDRWEAYNRLESIDRNLEQLVHYNRKLVEAIQQLASVLWNERQR